MKSIKGTITRIFHEFDQPAAEIFCSEDLGIRPGQYVSISQPGRLEVVPSVNFPIGFGSRQLVVAQIPSTWMPGMDLSIRGAFGRGFQLSENSQHLCLVAWDVHPLRLMSLIHAATLAGQEMILVWDSSVSRFDTSSIPEGVEILPHQNLADAITWADRIAMDCPLSFFKEMTASVGLLSRRIQSCPVEVLVSTTMPCLGIADCGICAVPTRKSYRLACKDGPVFDFQDLDFG